VIHRPAGIGAFEFAVLASLRAAQLCRGCVPRVEGDHCRAVTAQMEVAGGTVTSAPRAIAPLSEAIELASAPVVQI